MAGEDRVFGLAGGVDDDGAIVGDGLQRHAQVGVLVDGVQAHEGDGLVLRLDLAHEVRSQSGLTLRGGFLYPRGSPLRPQVVDAAHRVLVEGDEGDLGIILAPGVASPHSVSLGFLERLPHARLFDGQGAVLEARDRGDLVFLRNGHECGCRHGVLVSRNCRSRRGPVYQGLLPRRRGRSRVRARGVTVSRTSRWAPGSSARTYVGGSASGARR